MQGLCRGPSVNKKGRDKERKKEINKEKDTGIFYLNPPLATWHFSQIQETLAAFKQVIINA